MNTKTKRYLTNLFAVISGIFFIVFGVFKLVSPESNLDNLFGVLMIVYGVGSTALFPDWKGNR